MVAWCGVAHARTHRLDDPRRLVSEHHGPRGIGHEAIGDMDVAATDAASAGSDQDLSLPRLVDPDLLESQGLMVFVVDGGLQGELLMRSAPAGSIGRDEDPIPHRAILAHYRQV